VAHVIKENSTVPKIAYIEKKLGKKRMAIVAKANSIIEEYQRQGFRLTLRQLYYQFVARDILPNNMKSYAFLGDVVNDGRLCGYIDWHAIEDRTRGIRSVAHWTSPREIVKACANQFAIDKWATQPVRPEVWIEKDAIAGVVEGICSELDVPYFSCRGYSSQTAMWDGAMRLKSHLQNDQHTLILHFGDHDPSGKDMTRDIEERIELFMGGTELRRLALNMDQIEQYNPPPNPAKLTDSRAKAYIAEFGNSSWELDALEPSVIVQLVRDTIESVRDEDAWQIAVAEEKEHCRMLTAAGKHWPTVVKYMQTANLV
jgi:hypothetical protein